MIRNILLLLFLAFSVVSSDAIIFGRGGGRSSGKGGSSNRRGSSGRIIRSAGPKYNRVMKTNYEYKNYWFYMYVITNRPYYQRDYPIDVTQCDNNQTDTSVICFESFQSKWNESVESNCTSMFTNIIVQADQCMTQCNSSTDTIFLDFGAEVNQTLYYLCNTTFDEIINSINNTSINTINTIIVVMCMALWLLLV